jgi:hypothetical protein
MARLLDMEMAVVLMVTAVVERSLRLALTLSRVPCSNVLMRFVVVLLKLRDVAFAHNCLIGLII